jgi:hypothetical protein
MKRQICTLAILLLLVNLTLAQSTRQAGTKQDKETRAKLQAAAASNVTGSGTPGRLSKWTGVDGSNSFSLGNSNIFEDKFGKVGIGTQTPTSLLTVQGMIETTLGGYKFPDGTIQTTAGIAFVIHDGSLMGDGRSPSPLGIALGGVQTIHLATGAVTAPKIANATVVRSFNGLFDNVTLAAGANITITPSGNTLTIAATNALTGVAHDTTLQGDGTSGSPLGVAVPLNLTGAVPSDLGRAAIIKATNTEVFGASVIANGGSGGTSVIANGGDATSNNVSKGGTGVEASGGTGDNAGGGDAVTARGGTGSLLSGGDGVVAIGGTGIGVNTSGGDGIHTLGGSGQSGGLRGLAGRFNGDVLITGALNVTGTKNFKIDHPLDPENKYLLHAAIESSEVLNVYSGNVTTNEQGEATVTLPDWFEALNRDFRYQLTVVGQFAQAIVADEIKDNRFKIRTNAASVKVSWQVTGVRSDAHLQKHPFKAEENKPERERGTYLSPEAFNQPEERSVGWARHPELMRQLKQRRLEAEQMRQSSPNKPR